VADENKRLWQQNRELQARLSESEARLRTAPDPNQVAAMQQEITARDQKIAELEASLRAPTPNSDPGIAGIETSYDPQAGTMTVDLPGDVLFDSGKATLKESSKATLNKIVAALKSDYAGKQVYVDGHTDTDPINKTKGQWEDNLDLSANRAMAVSRYLTSQGIDPELVAIRGFGQYHPKGNKAQSRRVEIVVQVK
jgi:outer membrane protein OmpA-like peptidoglycan-associated protein